MCQKCIDAIKETWKDLPEENYDDLLMGATCFPFGDPEEIKKQLIEIGEKSNYNLGFALEIAWIEMKVEMRKCREEELEKLRNGKLKDE